MNYKKETLEKHKKRIQTLLKNGCYNAACKHISKHHIPGFAISKTRAKKEYNLSNKDLTVLHYFEMPNPHYKCSSPMKCFLIYEIESKYCRNGKIKKLISIIESKKESHMAS